MKACRSTRYKRRMRLLRWTAQRLTAERCPVKRANRYACGGKLHVEFDRIGATLVVCDWCDRTDRGVCRYCPNPVSGRRVMCRTCRRRRLNGAQRRYYGRNVEQLRAEARDYQRRRRAA